MNSIISSGGTVFWPFGLLKSLAILATNLLIEIPADEVKPVFSKISSRISLAVFEAEKIPFLFSVTSKYASSSDKVSTKSVYEK